jgi:hypothetical protein
MSDYSVFLDYVLPHVAGVPEALAKRCIRDAVIDFCDETKLYEAVLDGTLVKAGITEFDLELPSNTRLSGVSKLTLEDGSELQPMRHFVVRQSTIDLLQPMSSDTIITATVSAKPTRASTTCPSFIYEDWAEVIGFGAQAMLFNMVNEEWYDQRAANTTYSLYRNGVTKAKRYAKTGRIMGNTMSSVIDLE